MAGSIASPMASKSACDMPWKAHSWLMRFVERIDAKRRLLALGGTVSANVVPGSPDHRPVFEAVAELGLERAVAAAATKRDAETSACLGALSRCQKSAVPIAGAEVA